MIEVISPPNVNIQGFNSNDGFTMLDYKNAAKSNLITEKLAMQNVNAMIDLFDAKLLQTTAQSGRTHV